MGESITICSSPVTLKETKVVTYTCRGTAMEVVMSACVCCGKEPGRNGYAVMTQDGRILAMCAECYKAGRRQ